MATINRGVQAFALVLLFLLSGPISQAINHANPERELTDSAEVFESSGADLHPVLISSAGSIGTGPSLQPPVDSSVQSMELYIQANAEPRDSGFTWSDWSQSGVISNGLVEESDGSLTLGFQGIHYDFDKDAEGWVSSSSSYAYRNTVHSCGMNNSQGGSYNTRGASVTATSPAINLQGFSGLTVGAWIKQGSYQCGEEPDYNEDFKLEYRSSSGSWITMTTQSGSTSGSSATPYQLSYTLPSNAYHSTFQIRARQTSGSGTCCDYWFFDDVIIPGQSGANLTTRSFGWGTGVDDLIDQGRYPPIFVDAHIPDGASLNWNVIDDHTGNVVAGLSNQSGKWIDLSVVDWFAHDSLHLRFEFIANGAGESPKLYSISGGGVIDDSFHGYPVDSGWEIFDASWNSGSSQISGSINGTLTSPVWSIGMPIAAYTYDAETTGVLGEISIDGGPWQNLSTQSQRFDLEQPAHSMQLRYTGQSTGWTISDLEFEIHPSMAPFKPYLDVDNDGVNEWDVADTSVGTWGNQDLFADGSYSANFTHAGQSSTFTSVLVPKDAEAFQVTAYKQFGSGNGVQTLALWVGNSMITQIGGVDHLPTMTMALNQSEMDVFSSILDSTSPVISSGGQLFVQAKIEVVADAGTYSLSGLNIPYHASESVTYTALDETILSINRARLDSSLAGDLPLKFGAESAAALGVDLVDYTWSEDVTMGPLTFTNDSQTWTPSQMWRAINTRAQIHSSSANMVMLNLYSDSKTARWMVPINSGTVLTHGDADVLIHDGNNVVVNSTGEIHDMLMSVRTSQAFDDQSWMRLESRVILANGVVSMPAIREINNQAIDNDLMIETVEWSTSDGVQTIDDPYIRALENLTIRADIGFENAGFGEHPFPGEFLLELYRDGEFIVNTTEIASGHLWEVTTTTPFTSGNITYSLHLTPLAGGGLSDTVVVNRTFVIDPLAPVVVGANIRHYDHRESSTHQQIIINITDQPVLPTDVTLMFWTEWANDLDGDGWPSEGEYIPRTLSIPSYLNNNYGTYHTFVDDTAGFPGEKIAGYIVGKDAAGHAILQGGSDAIDDHLFMYQLGSDGSPSISGEGFEWVDGRKAWLHPQQTYGLNISFTELNGVSDIQEIEVSLADNIASDRMTLRWDSSNNRCSSDSDHIVIVSCRIKDSMGMIPDAYTQDLILYLEIQPQWTIPDLGDTRREPMVKIIDRAGNQDVLNFPQSRWRFSAEMMVAEDLSLWVENGALNNDGARVAPGSPIELSGQVHFFRSGELPQFDCDIETRLDGVKDETRSENGLFTASLNAPVRSGHFALTWSVSCMPPQGIDLTSPTEAVRWILVDDEGPEVIEFNSPRPGSILEPETHLIQVVISENYGIDVDSVELYWWLSVQGSSGAVYSGNTKLNLDGTEDSGLRLVFTGAIDISEITDEVLREQTVLNMRLEGRDQAGNQFERSGNSEAFPAGTWLMIHHRPEFSIDTGGAELSKLDLEVDENTAVQIHIRNTGLLGGDADLHVEVVKLDGSRETLARTSVYVDALSVSTAVVDWKPDTPGIQWVEVTLLEETEQTRMVDVKPAQEQGFLSEVIGDANPWLITIALTLVGFSLILILAWLRLSTARRGAGDEWLVDDEFDEFDD